MSYNSKDSPIQTDSIFVIIIKRDSIIQSQLKVVGACNLVGLGLDQSVDSLVESLHQDLEYL